MLIFSFGAVSVLVVVDERMLRPVTGSTGILCSPSSVRISVSPAMAARDVSAPNLSTPSPAARFFTRGPMNSQSRETPDDTSRMKP